MNRYMSDHHLGHANIIKHCNRPFRSVEEMDEVILRNHNEVTETTDDVYLGGDLMYKCSDPLKYLKQMKGKKHLVIGNHDKWILKDRDIRRQFVEIDKTIRVYEGNVCIELCHYPMVEWDGYFQGVLHFYGHIHNNDKNVANKIMKTIKNAYSIGADDLGFTPRTFKEIVHK